MHVKRFAQCLAFSKCSKYNIIIIIIITLSPSAFFFKDFIYSFMRDSFMRDTERDAET